MASATDTPRGRPSTDPADRLVDAMVEEAAFDGYRGATVSRVSRRAGLSRRAFYGHFANRDECFRAAYRRTARQLAAALALAAAESSPEDRPAALIDALLALFTAEPAAARLLLVEGFAVPAPLREEHEQCLLLLERAVGSHLDAQEGSAEPIQIPAAALIGGVGEAIVARLLGGDRDPTGLRGELLAWLHSYRLRGRARPLPQAAWRRLGPPAPWPPGERSTGPSLLPRGRSALAPSVAAAVRRRRILEAMAGLVAAEGYEAVTVERIVAAARVPRAAFYSHFAGKQAAFLAAQTETLQGAVGRAAAQFALPLAWPERVCRAGEAFLSYLASRPDFARLEFIESYAAGEAAIRHRRHGQAVVSLLVAPGLAHPALAGSLDLPSEATAGAISALVRSAILARGAERLPGVLPSFAYTALAPLIGPDAALGHALRPPLLTR